MKRFVFGERGSITTEAVIVFPWFLALMILLINFLNVLSVYISMDHAVSETVKQIATHSYPLKHLQSNNVPVLPPSTGIPGSPTDSGVDILAAVKGGIAGEISRAVAGELAGASIEPVVSAVARNRINSYMLRGAVRCRDFKITDIKVYSPAGEQGTISEAAGVGREDIALTVEYKVKFPVPFFPVSEITLSNTAVERAWVDG